MDVCFQIIVLQQLSIHIPTTLPALWKHSESCHIQNVHKVKRARPHTYLQNLDSVCASFHSSWLRCICLMPQVTINSREKICTKSKCVYMLANELITCVKPQRCSVMPLGMNRKLSQYRGLSLIEDCFASRICWS